MSSYFSLPSFARAKRNKEDLEKTNPQNPVLKEEDVDFLEKQITREEQADKTSAPAESEPTQIADDGEEKEVPKEEITKGSTEPDQVVVPETQPSEPTDDKSGADANAEAAEDPPEQVPESSESKRETPAAVEKPKKSKKSKGLELPSQEEAEAATRGFNVGSHDTSSDKTAQGEKRTWASYLPSVGSKKPAASDAPDTKPADSEKDKAEAPADSKNEESAQPQRTWADYASSAYSSLPAVSASLPSLPSLPASWKSKDKDSNMEPVLNEDGTVNEEETKKKQEQEVSVLLDRLDLSSINNRVFAFSGETQKIYERFSLVLKDTMNGGPTAYDDMEKLMKDAGPQLEKQFEQMPPFVQTLVKSLPAKLGTTLGPELLAAASEKPGYDMKVKMAAENKASGSASNDFAATETDKSATEQKKKRKIPGLKGLIGEQGAVASILRNVVNFLRVRFPFLASTTNVVMSLAVFILMFVFYYCHKRGREVRLAREAANSASGDGTVEEVEDDDEIEVTDEEEPEEEEGAEGEEDAEAEPDEKTAAEPEAEKTAALNQSDPTEVPLPEKEKGEQGAELEAEKAVGA